MFLRCLLFAPLVFLLSQCHQKKTTPALRATDSIFAEIQKDSFEILIHRDRVYQLGFTTSQVVEKIQELEKELKSERIAEKWDRLVLYDYTNDTVFIKEIATLERIKRYKIRLIRR